MSEDLPPFPGTEEQAEEPEKDNVSYFPGVEEALAAAFNVPQVSIAQQRQEKITEDVLETLGDYAGDIAVLGGLIRRFEMENQLGHPITEEEFIYISEYMTAVVMNSIRHTIYLLVAEGHKLYNN